MPTLHQNPEDIALNEREETLQFIERPPSVFMRFGITAVACVVVLLLALSYFIKYPDIVVAKVVLTTENPPIHVLAKTGGRVSDIFIKNNETVKTGLTTTVRLDAFPYQQYGILRGAVLNIALVPQKEDYQLEIQLPVDLTTSYGKTLNFRQEMQGIAHIITEDRRVVERILDRFRDLMRNR